MNATKWGYLSNGVAEFDDGTDEKLEKCSNFFIFDAF
jgi:hypothetical protein